MKPKHNRIFCIGCHHSKMLFETQAKAENFIRFNGSDIAAQSGKAPSRSYYCTFCCGWHVTSVEGEENAKERDERDEKVWTIIRERNAKAESGRKAKSRNQKPVVKPEKAKAVPPKPKKLPNTAEGWEIMNMLLQVDSWCLKVKSSLLRCAFQETGALVNHAEIAYKETLQKAEQYGIESKTIDQRGDKIESIKETIIFLAEFIDKPEKRREYMDNLSDKQRRKELSLMVERIDNFERIEHLFEEANAHLDRHEPEFIPKICAEIEKIVNEGMAPRAKHEKEAYRKRIAALNTAMWECPTSQREGYTYYRHSILSVIELIELANSSLSEGNVNKSEKIIAMAEEKLPDKSDNNVQLLKQQIKILKHKLGLDNS